MKYASTVHQPILQSQQQLTSNVLYTDIFMLNIGFKNFYNSNFKIYIKENEQKSNYKLL